MWNVAPALLILLLLTGCAQNRERAPETTAASRLVPPAATVDTLPFASELPSFGDTRTAGGWQVRIHRALPYERYVSRPVSPPPQGKLVVIEFAARNVDQKTTNFTTRDFFLIAPDGREFAPARQTASIEHGFAFSQTVQPGLVTQNRVVFDVDPSVTDYTLRVLGMTFATPLESGETESSS